MLVIQILNLLIKSAPFKINCTHILVFLTVNIIVSIKFLEAK